MNSKIIAIFFFFALTTLTNSQTAQEIDDLLKDEVYVQSQIDCVLNRRTCDKMGNEIKALIPEAIKNNCRRCTPTQAMQSKKIITHMQKHYPREFRQVIQSYIARH
ncbi:ejaculatory bulb-specific protein 3-like [Belonocnema kinseyi]|uniref:ejaculatory bulb-specific protein 3-like n=1 Tax=Belonocnema kinseyi TaxID=2817044 RepID=UPI00143DBB58|nr:ejaculatory bulb-specific protein 3-like [Belonocnema kinseyi]